MLCIRNRPRQSGPIFLICSFLLVIAFIVHFRILYITYQKQHRIEDYKTQMNDMFDKMKSMERVANSTANLLRKLQKVVNDHKAPNKKNSVHNTR